ncbi:MAG: 3-isopropylmalate dehydratase small subunit [Candidatus Bathyarchaeia archaeon]|jgi:3-isopropylmalate/(R)-2-methylmalate dehydratase small subunit
MEPLRHYEGIVVPLDRINVDTDQIIPKQFLKRIDRTDFSQYLFYDWRFHRDGDSKSDFILNYPRYKNGKILLTRENFGCGSSREHAVWALRDYGFRVLIAPSYGDIFYNNCFKNGTLPITLDDALVNRLFKEVEEQVGYTLEIDLEKQTIVKLDGEKVPFEIDSFRKKCLLEGLDDISLTLQHEDKIRSHEMKLYPFQRVEVRRP